MRGQTHIQTSQTQFNQAFTLSQQELETDTKFYCHSCIVAIIALS